MKIITRRRERRDRVRYATLHCTAPGCDQSVEVDRKHVPNLTARGGWTCHLHKRGA